MIYYIYPLKFLTPVHFGNTADGGNLEKTSMLCSADTYFSALVNEAAMIDEKTVCTFIEKFKNKEIVLSSLFPYLVQDDVLHLYLPKPYIVAGDNNTEIKSFTEMKKTATKMKKSKKSLFVRASNITEYIQAVKNNIDFNDENPYFVSPVSVQQVNCRLDEPLPYFIGGWRYNDNAGLYFIVGFENEDDLEIFDKLIESLGYSGIGGKRSSGFGKYELLDNHIELSTEDYVYEDDFALAEMLNNDNADFYMNIAPVHPLAKDIEIVKKGYYKIIKRSGFVYSPLSFNTVKKNNIYMLAEGSTFEKMLRGQIAEEDINEIEHKIYRNGTGLFVGLNYE